MRDGEIPCLNSGLQLACWRVFVTNWTREGGKATMSSMSASDAAPLPRLGEVFFDVRGSSRSMRLSWYADTGVSVFSIWQGGTCTGTFRLPIEELPRMIQALQRGPDGDAEGAAGRPVAGQAQRGRPARDLPPGMPPSAVP